MTRNECDHGQLRRSCQICELIDENHALAAHAERLRKAWSEADSNSEESVLDDVFGHWLNGDDYDALAEAFDDAPDTSLAKRDARVAAEAIARVICDLEAEFDPCHPIIERVEHIESEYLSQAGGDV